MKKENIIIPAKNLGKLWAFNNGCYNNISLSVNEVKIYMALAYLNKGYSEDIHFTLRDIKKISFQMPDGDYKIKDKDLIKKLQKFNVKRVVNDADSVFNRHNTNYDYDDYEFIFQNNWKYYNDDGSLIKNVAIMPFSVWERARMHTDIRYFKVMMYLLYKKINKVYSAKIDQFLSRISQKKGSKNIEENIKLFLENINSFYQLGLIKDYHKEKHLLFVNNNLDNDEFKKYINKYVK